MGTTTPILDRIRKREAEAIGKVIELRRKPRWVQRLNAGRLPAKDFTDGAYVPRGSGAGA